MKQHELQVAVDVGARRHRVAVGDDSGQLLEEFGLEHTAAGFAGFFTRIERMRETRGAPVAVTMEGFQRERGRILYYDIIHHSLYST